MKSRMVKALALATATVMMVGLMTGCTVTKTSTSTTTTTDADGNTTTTTTTSSSENGKTTTETTTETTSASDSESTVASLAISNETGADLYEMYFSLNESDSWGENILDDDDPLLNGYTITYTDALTYNENGLIWDLKAADQEGNSIEFEGLDLSFAADPENITILLSLEDDGTYSAEVQ